MSCSHERCSDCVASGGAFSQTLDELDFERSLCGAAASNDLARATKLIERSGDKKGNVVNECDHYGYSPLHYACRNGSLEMVQLMLKHGAEVNRRTKSTSATPLHRACFAGRDHVVRLLLNTHSCQVSLQDVDGETALMKCWKQQQWPCVRVFIDYALGGDKSWANYQTESKSKLRSSEVSQEILRCVSSASSLDKQPPSDIIASIAAIRESCSPN